MRKILWQIVLSSMLFGTGCHKSFLNDGGNWTAPKEFSRSQDSLISSFSLYKWNGSLLAFNADNSTRVYFLAEDGVSWQGGETSPVESLPLSIDPATNRWLTAQATLRGDRLEVDLRVGRIIQDKGFVVEEKRALQADKTSFFKKTATEVSFGGLEGKPIQRPFWGAAFDGSEICLPYSVAGETIRDRAVVFAEGPFANGVICSVDSGLSWKRERIDSSDSIDPNVNKTTRYYYFTAGRTDTHELWYSRKEIAGGEWSTPTVLIAGSFATWNSAVAQDDTVHVCWLDRQHEKKRSNLVYPWRKNYEVAYCQRRDSDLKWSEPTLVSKGLLYAYRPMMSVEGEKLVIAWSGVQHAKDGHDENAPNDIYFATSRDSGRHWSNPLRVTDNVKSGTTAGCPKVALHKGVIHLFYIQGTINYKMVSAGMVKLNQPPWPILYQQRPFPN